MKNRYRKRVLNVRTKGLTKVDPTRTLTLRRAFNAKLRRQFAQLKGRILKLVSVEDAFGLAQNVEVVNSNPNHDELGRFAPKESASDHPAVSDFMEKLEEERVTGQAAEEIGNALTRDNLHQHIVVRDGKLVGAAAVEVNKFGIATIHDMGSLAKGVGTTLMDQIKAGRGKVIAKDVKPAAVGFYQKVGFRPSRLGGTDMMWDRSQVTNVEADAIRQKDNYDCGVAALQAAASVWDIEIPDAEDELGTTRAEGTTPEAIIEVAEEHGLEAYLEQDLTVMDLQTLSETSSIICCVTMWGGGHYVTVTDVRKGNVHFIDPSVGSRSMPAERFLRIWHDKDEDTGKEYTQAGIVISNPLQVNNNPNHDSMGRFAESDFPADWHGASKVAEAARQVEGVVVGGAAYSIHAGIPAKDLDVVMPGRGIGNNIPNQEIHSDLINGVPVSYHPDAPMKTKFGTETSIDVSNTEVVNGVNVLTPRSLINSTKTTDPHSTEKVAALIRAKGLPREFVRELNSRGQGHFIEGWHKVHGGDPDDELGVWKKLIKGGTTNSNPNHDQLGRFATSDHPAVNKLLEHLHASEHISPERKEHYTKAIHTVTSRMPQAALDRIDAHVVQVNFHGSPKELTSSLASSSPAVAAAEARGAVVNGVYRSSMKTLELDGDVPRLASDDIWRKDRSNAHETYAHELTHAIDGPGFPLSTSNEWTQAWMKDIGFVKPEPGKAKLSVYATSKPQEGFAEFGRLVYGTATSRDAVAAKYPNCHAYFKSQGLL